MKYLPILAFLCACSSNQIQAKITVVADKPAMVDSGVEHKRIEEQEKYEDSVYKINRAFAFEYTRIQYCYAYEGQTSKSCKDLLTDFCNIDIYIDSRSIMHDKIYCK